jgi:hypothetical protein
MKDKRTNEQKRADREREYLEKTFLPKLEAINSFGDAALLLKAAPREGTIGYACFHRLGTFLHFFTIPERATRRELAVYLKNH